MAPSCRFTCLSLRSPSFPLSLRPAGEERREERFAIVTTTEGRSEVSERDEGSDEWRDKGMEGP